MEVDKLRRGMMIEEALDAADRFAIKVSTHASVDEVPAHLWSLEGRPGALYGSAAWFRLAEISGTRLCYLVARDLSWGKAHAVLPVLLDPPRPGGSYDHVQHLVQPALGEEFHQQSWHAPLVAGSWNSNLVMLPFWHPADQTRKRRDILSALLDELERIAKDNERSCIMFPFLTTNVAEELAELVGDRGLFFRAPPTTWMHIRGRSFDKFLDMCGRQPRRNARYELNRFRQMGGEFSIVPTKYIEDEIVNLVMQNKIRYGGISDREKVRNLLSVQTRIFDDHMLSFCSRRNGRLVAAANMIASHGGLYGRSFGFDYEQGSRHMEYFTLVYYEPFRYCVEHGLTWFHAGPQAYEVKIRRGLHLIPLWTLFLPAVPAAPAQQLLVQRWNTAERERWRCWFSKIMRQPLPPDWHALNEAES